MGILNTHNQTENTAVLLSNLCAKETKIAVVGLEADGLSTALYLASKYRVIGYDTSRDITTIIQQQKHPFKNITSNNFTGKDFFATSITNLLEVAQFYVITNSTDKLTFKKATAAVAKHLKVGDVVVFQNMENSSLVKENSICMLERISGLLNNIDFTVAFRKASTTSVTSNNKINVVESEDCKTRKLVHNVFENITVLTVIKPEKVISTNVIANRIETALKQQQPVKKVYSILLKGITSKKNSNELKDSKAIELYMALYRKGIQVKVQDNHVLSSEVEAHCSIELSTTTSQRFDAIVNAVEHDNYQAMTISDYKKNSTSKTLYFDALGNKRNL